MKNIYTSIDPRPLLSGYAISFNQSFNPPTSQTTEQQDAQQREEAKTNTNMNMILQGTNRSVQENLVMSLNALSLNTLTLNSSQEESHPKKPCLYLTEHSPVMSKTIHTLPPKKPDEVTKLTDAQKDGPVQIKEVLPLLSLGPHQQYLGWLLLSRTVPNTISDPVESDFATKSFYKNYSDEKDKLLKLTILNTLDKLRCNFNKREIEEKLDKLKSQTTGNVINTLKMLGGLGKFDRKKEVNKLSKEDSKKLPDPLGELCKLCEVAPADKQDKMRLCYTLGKLISPEFIMPGDSWIFEPITEPGGKTTGIRFEKKKHLSIVDIFNDRPQLSNDNMKLLQGHLDHNVVTKVITEEERARALSNLQSVSTHFSEGKMVADLVVSPRTIIKGKDNYVLDEQGKNYVYVECTPREANYLYPRQVFMAEDIVLDEQNDIRLSDQLREDIRAYFEEMGWTNCLGKTLCPAPEGSALSTSDLSNAAVISGASSNEQLINCNDQHLEMLEHAFLLFSTLRAVSLDSNETPDNKAQAQLKMEVLKEQIYRWAQSNIGRIDPEAFKNLMRTLGGKVSIVTYSECSLQVLDAIKQGLETKAGSALEYDNYKKMLTACRDVLSMGIKNMKVDTADKTGAYLLANGLHTVITALDKKIAAHGQEHNYQNSVEEEKKEEEIR